MGKRQLQVISWQSELCGIFCLFVFCLCTFLVVLISLMFETQGSLGIREKPDGTEVCVERRPERQSLLRNQMYIVIKQLQ